MTRVFVAGATGAIGKRLVPWLVASGYEVIGMTRNGAKAETLRELGAEPVVADGLDPIAVMKAVMHAEPDVVVHEMTGLSGITSLKHFDRQFARTNLLRTKGTDYLLEASRAAGARRFIAQSFGNWDYERTGSKIKTEEDPLDPDPPNDQVESLRAIRHLERAVLDTHGIEGIVLRYANFYGPGTGIAADGEIAPLLRKRRYPIVGDGRGVWSFVHIDDAAIATVAAIEVGRPGVYNVADDDPACTAEWLPELAKAIGAKPPRHVPAWLARLGAGEAGVSMFTRIRGASNAKARRELAWIPRFRSWRTGFFEGLADGPQRVAVGRG